MKLDLNKQKKAFININKSYLATILKLFSLKKIFKVFDKKYFMTNFAYLY